MNTLLIALLFTTASTLAPVLNECLAKVNTSDSDVQNFYNDLPFATREGKCLMACLFQKVTIMTEDGKFAVEKMEGIFKLMFQDEEKKFEKSVRLIEDCNAEVLKEEDSCELASKLRDCMKRKAEEYEIY